MQKTTNIIARATALLLACGAAAAHAQDGTPANPNELRAGLYFVHHAVTADDLSGPFTPAGINLSVDNVTTLYLAYIRRFDPHWSVEFAGGVPPETKTKGKGPAVVGSVPFDGQEVATAKWLSPSVLVDYTFLDPSSAFRPYVGVGVNFTHFYELNSTPAGDAANGGPTHIRLTNSFGPAATVGLSYRITDQINVYGSFSVARVNSHYTSETSGVVRETHIHFNPRAAVISVGYAF